MTYMSERALRTPLRDDPKPQAVKQEIKGVAAPSIAYQKMQPYWDLVDAIRGGTSKMRELGTQYLPQEPGEKDAAYERRLSRVVLSPWYARLVRGLVGMVLRKPPQLEDEELAEGERSQLEEHVKDLTLEGDDLATFTKMIFESAIDYGYAGILVEYPDVSEQVETLADEVALGARPYWMAIAAPDILRLKYKQMGSQRMLTQVKLKQRIIEDDGDFEEQEIEQVLVYSLVDSPDDLLRAVSVQVFRKEEDEKEEKWVLFKESFLSLPEIPFAVCYSDRQCRQDAQPPMLEVAYLNVKHYQLQGDLDHALHVSAFPRAFIFGTTADEIGNLDSVDEMICIPNPEARVEWVGAQYSNFQPTDERINKIEMQMAALSLATLVAQKNVGESAEAKRLDRAQGDSIMAVIAQSLQNALNYGLYYHSRFMGWTGTPTCQVNRDFDPTRLDAQLLNVFAGIASNGKMSTETLLTLIQRAEVGLGDDWSVEDELERIKKEYQQDVEPMAIASPQLSEDVLPDLGLEDNESPLERA